MSEMALINARRPLLEHDAKEGDKNAKLALEVSSNSNELFASIQVAITLVGFFSSAVAATTLSDPLAQWLSSFGINVSIAYTLAPIFITLIVSYITIVLGELVPKRIALSDAENVSKHIAGFMIGFSKLIKPLVWITSTSANALSKLLHIKSPDNRTQVSEEELRYIVEDTGELTEEEKTIIHEVFDLGDTLAHEVMIPRVDICAIKDNMNTLDVLQIMQQTGYSRIPVYHENIDKIIGIAHIKDLISLFINNQEKNQPIVHNLREANFIPESKDIMALLSEMRNEHEQMVIVVDEYGGTAGLLTIEDIVEEIVGEIEDEFDPDNKYITQISEREWLVDGRFSISDAIELGWPVENTDEYETIAGFILALVDDLPLQGQTIDKDGWSFCVQSMRGNRIALLRITAPVEVV